MAETGDVETRAERPSNERLLNLTDWQKWQGLCVLYHGCEIEEDETELTIHGRPHHSHKLSHWLFKKQSTQRETLV